MLQNVVAAEESTLVKEKQKPQTVPLDVRITSSNLNCVLHLHLHTRSVNYLFLIIGPKVETTTRWARTTSSTYEPVGWGAWDGGYRRLSMATAPPSI